MNDKIIDNNLRRCLNDNSIDSNGDFKLEVCKDYGEIKTIEGIDSIEGLKSVDIKGYPRIDINNVENIKVYSGPTNYFSYIIIFMMIGIFIYTGFRSLKRSKNFYEDFKE